MKVLITDEMKSLLKNVDPKNFRNTIIHQVSGSVKNKKGVSSLTLCLYTSKDVKMPKKISFTILDLYKKYKVNLIIDDISSPRETTFITSLINISKKEFCKIWNNPNLEIIFKWKKCEEKHYVYI